MDLHKLTDAELKLKAEHIIKSLESSGSMGYTSTILSELLDRYTKKSAIVDEMTRLKI